MEEMRVLTRSSASVFLSFEAQEVCSWVFHFRCEFVRYCIILNLTQIACGQRFWWVKLWKNWIWLHYKGVHFVKSWFRAATKLTVEYNKVSFAIVCCLENRKMLGESDHDSFILWLQISSEEGYEIRLKCGVDKCYRRNTEIDRPMKTSPNFA